MRTRPHSTSRIPLARARFALGAVAAAWLIFAPADKAAAECTGGFPVGQCEPSEIAFEGCCTSKDEVHWCENGTLCQLACKENVNYPTNSCGEESPKGGCCDAEIMRCVCDIDPLCCDNTQGFGWDNFCVSEAVQFCGGVGDPCGPAPDKCGWNHAESFYDCVVDRMPDPNGVAPLMCGGGGCEPACTGRECGPDGCGGQCGNCETGEVCGASGQCAPSGCVPVCGNRECGPDGCGGHCGTGCGGGTCNAQGRCENTTCTPQCAGRNCGADGCGGTCGECTGGALCTDEGVCKTNTCTPSCGDRECGPDGCGGRCGACDAGERCDAEGACVELPCVPDCSERACGDDGCGGSCGLCEAGLGCDPSGTCNEACSCEERECGMNRCGTESCGTCAADEACNFDHQCVTGAAKPDGVPPDTTGGTGGVSTQPGDGCGGGAAGGLWLALGLVGALRTRRKRLA